MLQATVHVIDRENVKVKSMTEITNFKISQICDSELVIIYLGLLGLFFLHCVKKYLLSILCITISGS